MSPEDICDPVCLHVLVLMSLHLHLNAKSVCLRGLACWLRGMARRTQPWWANTTGENNLLLPTIPQDALRRWAQLDSSHGQKWAESLTRFIRASFPPCLLASLQPASLPSIPPFTRLLLSICPKSFKDTCEVNGNLNGKGKKSGIFCISIKYSLKNDSDFKLLINCGNRGGTRAA